MRITKVYTGFGDGGKTYLASGDVVDKCHPRVEAFGDVDELNSFIGFFRAKLGGDFKEVDTLFKEIQNKLFRVGADLATPQNSRVKVNRINEEDIKSLENLIDRFNSELEPLKEFVLPYGCEESTVLHICRTVCRRAERKIVKAMKTENINPNVQIYLNRLSDFLFVMARWINRKKGVEEELASF